MPTNGPAHDPYAALRIRNFRLYLAGSVIANIGLQMQTAVIGWEIYERTNSERALAMIGLVQVLPAVLLAIVSGHVADRFRRQWVVAGSISVVVVGSIALSAISYFRGPIVLMYGCLLLIAIGRAFHQPAKASLLPQVVPRKIFSNAVTWGMSGFQLSSVLGPALGGLLIAWTETPAIAYLLTAAAALTYVVMMLMLRNIRSKQSTGEMTLETLVAGFRFVWQHPVILAALALDLFAVLLGGATVLLPAFAKLILKVGPVGFGCLQAAPALGAITMAILLAHRPPMRHAGPALLCAVTGYGVATIVFGVSSIFWLSFAMLCLTGALDNVSVVVRHTLVQMLTPDGMRGRVSAVNSMFIGASNELGGFESGMVAYYFGPVIAVASGGIGTLIVVALVAILCPQLRKYGRLDGTLLSESEAAPRSSQHPATAAATHEATDQ